MGRHTGGAIHIEEGGERELMDGGAKMFATGAAHVHAFDCRVLVQYRSTSRQGLSGLLQLRDLGLRHLSPRGAALSRPPWDIGAAAAEAFFGKASIGMMDKRMGRGSNGSSQFFGEVIQTNSLRRRG